MSPAKTSLHSNHLATPPRDISPTPTLDSAKSDDILTPAQNASGASPLVRSPTADTLVSGDLHSDSRQIEEPVKAHKRPHFWRLTPSPSPSRTLVSLAERLEGQDVEMEDAQPPSPEQTPPPLHKPVELEELPKPSVESLPIVDPRLRLYPFVLPPGLWDAKPQPDANGVEHEARPLLPLKPVASSSFVDPCTPAPPSPRVLQDPSLPTDHSTFRIPSPLLKNSPTATLHLSSTAPYPGEPEKQGQLVWLDLKLAYHLHRGGCVTVRNFEGRARTVFGPVLARKALGRGMIVRREAMGSGHTGAMQARRRWASAREAAQREAVFRALMPATPKGQRGPRGSRRRASVKF
ncbi:hypothetical protein L202_00699 [Cryptococcus amylolentus CBS 6039]|uniref:Uncharacterized protein n=2 Tax=Cryptococcus amylolentus TaxID=104669 RepID=A0A1E3I8L5_9TREE|nr:hypothetical protein L202_00699 [Cryptococcus amylolentus CBS 6039]ODN84838.1 hypothetical protein L202_00699 [Cryptococcus amylolentus CBS 6039]ODO11445.1 hypothetical protein I350_00225 [Cryptococcus amylolentus CBS 6273]